MRWKRISDFTWPRNLKPVLTAIKQLGPAVEQAFRDAFQELGRRGRKHRGQFDASSLAGYLGMLLLVRDEETAGRTPRPLKFGHGSNDELKKRDLKKIEEASHLLQSLIPRLKKTHLNFYLHQRGLIPPGDILSPPFLENPMLHILDAPSQILELAKKHSALHMPLVDLRLQALCEYVNKTTGSWNDDLIVTMLGPLSIPHCQSPDALRVFRSRFTANRTHTAGQGTRRH